MTISDAHTPRLSPAIRDAGVATAVAIAMALTISVATEDGATKAPDALAYVLGAAVAALVLAWRRWPMGVLLGSVGVLFLYFGLDYPAFSPAVPLAAATYFAAVAGHLRTAAVVLAGVITFSVGWQTLGEDASLASVVGSGTLADAALLASVLLLGETVRSRRAWSIEVRRRLERAAHEREREAARRVADERLGIARELHDVIAHTIAAVNVQAGVAADVIDDAPDEAKAALRTIRLQTRTAIGELSAALAPLRAGDAPPYVPVPGLGELDALVEAADAAGVDVDLSVVGEPRPLPPVIELTGYRILQESLTNVVRHARADSAAVLVAYAADAVLVEVADDGRGPADGGDRDGIGGHGLAGMRERATAVGGSFDAGPRSGGGFRVRAHLPAP